MIKGNDREHFQDYREQTQVKHDILAAYLPAYYNILKRSSQNLVYIDGFAGPGCYIQRTTGQVFDGSPIRALQLIANNEDFSKQVSTIFIEADDVLFKQLQERVDTFYETHPNIRKPIYRYGIFSEVINQILSAVKGTLPPTFLFVDPCGVSGTSFSAISSVMEHDKCEVFIFFNIDGVRRIAGLPALSPVLVDLMGSEGRARTLHGKLRTTGNVWQREEIILSEYCEALTDDMGISYIIPFRVEHENQRKASHYLIHATRHPLGFSIMKDVMWRRGHGEDHVGGLEFRQRGRTNFIPMFDQHGEIKKDILDALTSGPRRVSMFTKDWPMRPRDMKCEAAYREALLELENEKKIEVLAKDGINIVSAGSRPWRAGKPTLAKDYYVRHKTIL